MGAQFGSIHVRGVSRDLIRDVLGELSRKADRQFYLAPEIEGWVSVYPSGHGQDPAISAKLADRVGGDVMHLLLYDGGVLYYYYYQDGLLRDEYDSCPDYFQKVTLKRRQAVEGHPERFRHLLGDRVNVPRLQSMLRMRDADDPHYVTTQLRVFADGLKIVNYDTSYEYLRQGDTDSIEEWARFEHIPDLAPKRALEAKARATLEARLERLRKDGLLAGDVTPAPLNLCGWQAGFAGLPEWSERKTAQPALLFQPPWSGGVPVGGPLERLRAFDVNADWTGRLFAIAGEPGDDIIAFWELPAGKKIAEAGHGRLANLLGFTATGEALLWIEDRMVSVRIDDGAVTSKSVSEARTPLVAVHPTQPLAVIHKERVTLVVLNTGSGEKIKEFWLDAPEDLHPMQQLQAAILSREARKHHAGAKAQLRRTGVPEPELNRASPLDEPLTAETPSHFVFSGDGRSLFVATDKAAWIFDWQQLLETEDEAPLPLHRFRVGKSASILPTMDAQQMVFGVAHDAARNAVLLAVGDGTVRQMDVASGEVRVILRIPDGIPVTRVALSGDGSVLATVLSPRMGLLLGGHAAIVGEATGSLNAQFPEERSDRLLLWNYASVLAMQKGGLQVIK